MELGIKNQKHERNSLDWFFKNTETDRLFMALHRKLSMLVHFHLLDQLKVTEHTEGGI